MGRQVLRLVAPNRRFAVGLRLQTRRLLLGSLRRRQKAVGAQGQKVADLQHQTGLDHLVRAHFHSEQAHFRLVQEHFHSVGERCQQEHCKRAQKEHQKALRTRTRERQTQQVQTRIVVESVWCYMVVARMSPELKRNVLVAVRRQIQRLLMTLGQVRARSKMEPRLRRLALRLTLEQGQSRFELGLLAGSWRGKGCLSLYRLGMMGSRCPVLRWAMGTVGNLHIHLPSAREEIQESRWARLRELEGRQTADSRVLPKDQMMGLLLRLRTQRQQSCQGLVVDCHSLVRSIYRPQN
jgi:hypothetical protein